MIYALTDETTNVWIDQVQKYFASNPVAQGFRWQEEDDRSKILIADRYPATMRRWPCIIINAISGDSQELGLHQSAGPEYDANEVEIGERFVGLWKARVEFTVEAVSEKDTKRVHDILWIGLERYIRFDVEKNTGGRVKIDPPVLRSSGRVTPRNITDTTVVYGTVISIGCSVEWQDVELYPYTVTDVAPTVTLLDC